MVVLPACGGGSGGDCALDWDVETYRSKLENFVSTHYLCTYFRYTAVFDLQNRVMVLENSTGVVTHVWKGYHHAQFGWIHTMKDKDNPDPGNSEFAILLVIYLPRRGLLEVWSPDQKSRFVIFY